MLHEERAQRLLKPGDEGVYHPREVVRLPVHLKAPSSVGKTYHLFVSPNIPGVAELAAELQEHAKTHGRGETLAVSSDPKEMGACMHYLLYLSTRTHDATMPHVG